MRHSEVSLPQLLSFLSYKAKSSFKPERCVAITESQRDLSLASVLPEQKRFFSLRHTERKETLLSLFSQTYPPLKNLLQKTQHVSAKKSTAPQRLSASPFFFTTFSGLHQNLGAPNQHLADTQKLLLSTEAETQPSANLNGQHSRTYKFQTPVLRTALQNIHTPDSFLLHFLSGPPGLILLSPLPLLPAQCFLSSISPCPS